MTRVKRIYPNPYIDNKNKDLNVINEILAPAKVFEGYWGGNFISPIAPAQSMLEVSNTSAITEPSCSGLSLQ